MNDEFESRVATLFAEAVDAQLGPRVAAPPFAPPATTDAARVDELAARRRRRFTFLAVAATVVAVVAAALALNAFAPSGGRGTHRHVAPATRSPHPAPHPKTGTLDGAAIALPKGWVARPYRLYITAGEDNTYGKNRTWCLTPRSAPVSTAQDGCPVQFASLVPIPGRLLDPDNQGGGEGDPEYCFQGQHLASDVRTGRLDRFGGREAVFYRADIRCTTGAPTHFAQYEVLGDPGYVLYASKATAAIRSAMTSIAQRSQLPAQTSVLWRADLGRVTSMTGTGKSVRLTLRRVYRTRTGSAPLPGPAADRTVHYTVARSLLKRGAIYGPVEQGSVLAIDTNGRTVTQITEDYSTR